MAVKTTYFQEFSEKELQLIKNPVFSDLDFGEEDANLASSLEKALESSSDFSALLMFAFGFFFS